MANIDTLGVNIHPTSYARYSDSGAVIAALQWLGIRWIRLDATSNPAQYSMYRAAGFKVVVVCVDAATVTSCVNAGAADIIECVNEPNNNGITAATCKTTNAAQIAAAGAVPTLCSALADPPDATYATAVGQVASTYGNVHVYRAMRSDSAWATWKNQHYNNALPQMSLNKDYFVTEYGWTGNLFAGGQTPTPDYIAAQQMQSDNPTFFSDAPAGTTGRCLKTFAYELVSKKGFDQEHIDLSDQSYFGCLFPTFKPKPQAFQLKEMLTL